MLVPPILLFFLDIPFFLWWVAPFMETPKCWNRSATTNGPNKWPNGQRLELPVKDGLWNIHQFGATGINRSATSPVGFWPMFFICQYPIIPLYTSHIYSMYIIFISHLEVRFPFRHRGTPSSHPSQQRPLFRSKEPVVGDPRWLPIASGDSISSTIPIETTRFIILLHHNWPVTCPIYCFFLPCIILVDKTFASPKAEPLLALEDLLGKEARWKPGPLLMGNAQIQEIHLQLGKHGWFSRLVMELITGDIDLVWIWVLSFFFFPRNSDVPHDECGIRWIFPSHIQFEKYFDDCPTPSFI